MEYYRSRNDVPWDFLFRDPAPAPYHNPPKPRAEGFSIWNQEAERILSTGRAVLLDVRPRAEFSAAHLPGSMNIPAADVEEQISDLGHDIVVLRGDDGTVARLLRHRGFTVFVMRPQ